jgi:uncharacterized membrane protein
MRGAALALAVAWPLSLHLAVLLASPEWPARVNAAALALAALLAALGSGRLRAFAGLAAFVAALAAALLHAPQLLVFAPPVVINAAVAWFFGSSLREGREPMISVFAKRERGGPLPPDLERHALVVTWLWTLLPATLSVTSLALALWAPLEVWSLFANVVIYVLLAALFVGEYLYRRVRYRHHRHASFADFLRHLRSARLVRR